jgi:hypothetical protein
MKYAAISLLLALAACAAVSYPVPDEQARRELAPTGKLRVGIGVGAAPSAFWATRDPATGRPRGVTVALGQALADRLGVPLELVAYPGARILDGYFHAAASSVAVPKGRPAALAYVSRFIEEGKADGTVRRALDGAGFTDLAVAPPEPKR